MERATENNHLLGGPFNTLGESGTTQLNTHTETVYGTGCNVQSEKARKRRGKTKYVGSQLAKALADVAREENDLKFLKQCFNGYFCLHDVVIKNWIIYGKYCKTRFCPTCNGIRKAEMIKRYHPVLKEWSEPCFLTLTTRSIPAKKLEDRIARQKEVFNRIIDKYEKRHKRKTGIKLIGLRSHESNFNPQELTYNPHFHIITPNYEIAKTLNIEWLKAWGKKASHMGQKIDRVKDVELHLIETIKYGAKIFTDPEMKKGMEGKKYMIFARAYYNILRAFESKHLLSSFGFKLPTETEKKETEKKELKNTSRLIYLPEINDWINPETGSLLTGYAPNDELKKIMSNIDTRTN